MSKGNMNTAFERELLNDIKKFNEDVFDFVKNVFKNDKTIYNYHGSTAERKSGQKPESGKRWTTPAEMAQDFAREHFKDKYKELWD